ncbi:MAG: GTP-binding protein [Oscillospiraceae bacterium]|nr:GTP-binding protein [Oscillospiraceae bacterium]
MTNIDIFSGFLGAGKTTLIKKLLKEAYAGEKIVLIENEFGEIGIDGGFMQEAGIQVNEMNSGCICCSLVGDFGKALTQVISEYHPDRILIEPSGVGKLSDVIAAVKRVATEEVQLGAFVTVVDANKCKVYLKNFGEFYTNQVESASSIILSRTDSISEDKLDKAVALLRELNQEAVIITTPWPQLDGKQILEAFRKEDSLQQDLEELMEEAKHHHHEGHCCCHEHHHEEHHHDEDCGCHGHHHEHEDHECCHGHHHHDENCTHHHEHDHHDEHCGCHDHHHEHEYHDEHCSCHDHHHEHHHHDADEVFQSWGVETHKKFSREALEKILASLDQEETFGIVLRAKGIVEGTDGSWLHFDYVPGESEIRTGCAAVTGRLCVIGSKLSETAVASLFGV